MMKNLVRIGVAIVLLLIAWQAILWRVALIEPTFEPKYYFGTDYHEGLYFAVNAREHAEMPYAIRRFDQAFLIARFIVLPSLLMAMILIAVAVASLLGTAVIRMVSLGRRRLSGRGS